MTISIIIAVLAASIVLFLIRLAKGHFVPPMLVDNAADHVRAVDIDAFRNLIDPEEREYLRQRLPPPDFRRIQRARLRAAVEYIACAAHNAAVLVRVGEAALRSGDQATVAAATKLIDNAIRLRIYALQAIPRLYLEMILPGTGGSPLRVVESYEQIARQVVLLGLRHPTRRISAAL